MSSAVGNALKEWRSRRRLSQLDLGLRANVSARHISFLETGRARPSRPMLLQLCTELAVPLSARNALLLAAGMAPAYERRELSAAQMQPVHAAVEWMLQRHAPFPAMALDRHWRITAVNPPAAELLGAVGMVIGDSIPLALLDNLELRTAIENLDDVLHFAILRLGLESANVGGDATLDALRTQLIAARSAQEKSIDGVLPPFIPTRYRLGNQLLSFVSTLAQFGTTDDIALSELKIELMFPADADTRAQLFAMAGMLDGDSKK